VENLVEKQPLLEKIIQWDTEISEKWNLYAQTSRYKKWFVFISLVISPSLWLFFGLYYFIYALVTDDFFWIVRFFSAFLQMLIFFDVLKFSFKRERPFNQNPKVKRIDRKTPNYSLPSGHTTFVTTFILFFFFELSFHPGLLIIAFSLIIIMGITRVYLGAHYPTDVMAGIIYGIITSVIFNFLTKLYWISFWNWLFP
jgi:membrane-associated phospholipid phosphatase